jgi:ABC-type branched-subunit amino acid transport system substrate-binding protein
MLGIRVRNVVVGAALAAVVATACGSAKTTSGNTTTTKFVPLPKSTTLGVGVTADSVKVGIALIDFSQVRQFTDSVRSNSEQQKTYQIYVDYVNAHGGIAGRKIVPDYKFASPINSAQILSECTGFTEDDNVFAVVGSFTDLSGDGQTCIAKQHKRVLLTFELTQAILDRSPAGLIVTPGLLPERTAGILVSLLKKENTLKGKKIAVVGDSNVSTVVKKAIVPAMKKAGFSLGSSAILSVNMTGDTSAGLQQLESFIERWKTEGVNALYLSGDVVSSKQFVQKIRTEMPDVLLATDSSDVLGQGQQFTVAHVKPNPYEGILTAAGPTPHEYDNSANWTYCKGIYKAATGTTPPNGEQTIKTKDGKIDDLYGTINDACQVITMFHDLAARVGKYLNDDNWINTVNTFGPIANRGTGQYSSFRAGKYSADDNWRLEQFDSTLGPSGLWKPITAVENINS